MHIIDDLTMQDMLGRAAAVLQAEHLRDRTDCVVVLNANGHIVQLSRGTLAELDVDHEDQIIGTLWSEMWPVSAQPALQEAVGRAFKGHIVKYWTHFDHLDGRVSEWDIRLTPLYDAARKINSVIVVSHNMSAH